MRSKVRQRWHIISRACAAHHRPGDKIREHVRGMHHAGMIQAAMHIIRLLLPNGRRMMPIKVMRIGIQPTSEHRQLEAYDGHQRKQSHTAEYSLLMRQGKRRTFPQPRCDCTGGWHRI